MKKIILLLILMGFSVSMFSNVYGSHVVGVDLGNFFPGETWTTKRDCGSTFSEGGKLHILIKISGSVESWISPKTIDCGILKSGESVERLFTINIPQSVQPGEYQFLETYYCESGPNIGSCVKQIDDSRYYVVNVIPECESGKSVSFDAQGHFVKCGSLLREVPSDPNQYGGYSSWDSYCKGEYGSEYFYGTLLEKCMLHETITTPPPSNDSGGGCLIATATYGSEMTSQVQQLRELRDNSLLQTEFGSLFMNTFNDVYYSFSPYIADYERENPLFKEMVKLGITPMISSLSILNYVDMDSEQSVLGYGISLIILNLMMYLGVPIVAIIGIKKKF